MGEDIDEWWQEVREERAASRIVVWTGGNRVNLAALQIRGKKWRSSRRQESLMKVI